MHINVPPNRGKNSREEEQPSLPDFVKLLEQLKSDKNGTIELAKLHAAILVLEPFFNKK